MKIKLYKLDRSLRHFLAAFLLLCTTAVSTGLIFVFQTTEMQASGIEQRYRGNTENIDDIGISESYPKSIFEMLQFLNSNH